MYTLIIASSIITILIMPSSFNLASWAYKKFGKQPMIIDKIRSISIGPDTTLTNPVIVAGYGRIGQNVVHGLRNAKIPFSVVEIDPEHIPALRDNEIEHIYGDCSQTNILCQAGLATAKTIVITFPDPMAVESTVRNALSLNPNINIVARVHRAYDAAVLKELGVKDLISPEYEASVEFLKRTLYRYGVDEKGIDKTVESTFMHIMVQDKPKKK